jgi:hypothetical protein
MALLSARDWRVIGLGSMVLGPILFFGHALPAVLGWEARARVSAHELHQELRRAEHAATMLPEALDSLENRARRLEDLAPALLPGRTRTAAGSALGGLLSAAAVESHLQVGSTRILLDSIANRTFARVRVQLDGEGSLEAAVEFLRRLEESQHLLAVRRLSVSQNPPGGALDRVDVLKIEMIIEGLALLRSEQ